MKMNQKTERDTEKDIEIESEKKTKIFCIILFNHPDLVFFRHLSFKIVCSAKQNCIMKVT